MKYCKDCRFYEWVLEYWDEPKCMHTKTQHHDKVHGPQPIPCRIARTPSHDGGSCGMVGKLFEPRTPEPEKPKGMFGRIVPLKAMDWTRW